jgi:hypothetical protein
LIALPVFFTACLVARPASFASSLAPEFWADVATAEPDINAAETNQIIKRLIETSQTLLRCRPASWGNEMHD